MKTLLALVLIFLSSYAQANVECVAYTKKDVIVLMRTSDLNFMMKTTTLSKTGETLAVKMTYLYSEPVVRNRLGDKLYQGVAKNAGSVVKNKFSLKIPKILRNPAVLTLLSGSGKLTELELKCNY